MAMTENSKRKMIKWLPEQVIRDEIFTRLPIKSLLRCKSVSKLWLSLISDPKFIKDHYNNCTMKNPNMHDCLVSHKEEAGLVILSRHEETCILPRHYYQLVGSIHGLVCLSHSDSYRHDKLSIWNPAIRQFKYLKSQPGYTRRWSLCDSDNIGLGYDPVTNDYKVVICHLHVPVDKRSASVYSCNSDTWTDLIVPDYIFPLGVQIPYCPATVVKDCPYWTSCSTYLLAMHSRPLVPVKFDIRSNEFKLLPEFQCDNIERDVRLVNMMDRPTLMEYELDSRNIRVDVYSLNEEESGVWSKMYSVGPIVPIAPNESERRYRNLSQGFKCGSEIMYYEYGIFSYYDLERDKISRIPGRRSYVVRWCFRYSPSLVSLQGMKPDTSMYLIHQNYRVAAGRTSQ